MSPTLSSFLQRVLGLRYDNSFGGDRVSPLSSARYADPLLFFSASKLVGVLFISSFIVWIPPVNSGGTVVLVSQDGIQRPPLHFPKGGHLLQFLTCLETGLLPHGQLDPPLWNQRGKVSRSASVPSYFQTTMTGYNSYSTACVSSILRGRFSPNCERGVHMAPAILYQIRRMMKRPIMCFESSFLAIRWSSVSVFNLPALPPCANRMKHHQTTLFS